MGTGLTQAAWWDEESLDLDPSPALSLSGVVERDARDMVVPVLPKVYDTVTILVTVFTIIPKSFIQDAGALSHFSAGGILGLAGVILHL